jgi:hypothetical protein
MKPQSYRPSTSLRGAEKKAEELYSGHESLDLLEILSGLRALSGDLCV